MENIDFEIGEYYLKVKSSPTNVVPVGDIAICSSRYGVLTNKKGKVFRSSLEYYKKIENEKYKKL